MGKYYHAIRGDPNRQTVASEIASEVVLSNTDNAKYKILIVDDDVINQQVLINQLTLQHYRFEVASNGPEALTLFATRGPFDLVL